MQNKFNVIEGLVLSFLQADTEITALAKSFHEKIKPDIPDYYDHELPAIAVNMNQFYRPENTIKSTISGVVEIVNLGADLNAMDDTVKELASLVINKLIAESPTNRGRGFNDQVEEILVDDAEIISAPLNEDFTDFAVTAFINISIGVVER